MGLLQLILGKPTISNDTLAAMLAQKLNDLICEANILHEKSAAKRTAMNLIVPQMAAMQIGVIDRKSGEPDYGDLYNFLNFGCFLNTTGAAGWAALFNNLVEWNNAYAQILTVGQKNVALKVLVRGNVTSISQNGQVAYTVYGQEVNPATVFHLKMNSYDGLVGTPYEEEVNCFKLAKDAEDLAKRFFQNGGNIARIWKLIPGATPEQERAIQAFIDKAISGKLNSFRDVVVPMHVDKIGDAQGITPREGQMIETRQFQRDEILALYGIDLRSLDLEKLFNITIAPILVNVEQEIARRLLTAQQQAQYRIEYLPAGRFRGSLEKQWLMATDAVKGILAPNEIRKWFGYGSKGPQYDAIINPNTTSAEVGVARHAAAAGGQG